MISNFKPNKLSVKLKSEELFIHKVDKSIFSHNSNKQNKFLDELKSAKKYSESM